MCLGLDAEGCPRGDESRRGGDDRQRRGVGTVRLGNADDAIPATGRYTICSADRLIVLQGRGTDQNTMTSRLRGEEDTFHRGDWVNTDDQMCVCVSPSRHYIWGRKVKRRPDQGHPRDDTRRESSLLSLSIGLSNRLLSFSRPLVKRGREKNERKRSKQTYRSHRDAASYSAEETASCWPAA